MGVGSAAEPTLKTARSAEPKHDPRVNLERIESNFS